MAKKPAVDIRIECPHCKSTLHVQVFKERIGEPEPVDYDITTKIVIDKQGRLFDDDKTSKDAKVK